MRKKKNPRMPNGFGQIRKLTGAKLNPYGVYPPQLEEDINGKRLPVKALCYVPTWTVAFAVLTSYNAGTYTQGMELELIRMQNENPLESANNGLIEGILADYARIRRHTLNIEEKHEPTFAEVYEMYRRDKFETGKAYSKAMINSVSAAYKNCSALHDRRFKDLKLDDLQGVIDSCTLKHSSVNLIALLLKQMYKYADAHELCVRDYSRFLVNKTAPDDEHGVPFTEDELRILWKHREDPTIEMILIMCFAGYRIAAYKTITVNLEGKYFHGGNKTAAGKGLQTPIHSAILPLVARRISRDGKMLASDVKFRESMYSALESLGIPKHTPHDCKHTFSALCERYRVNENDRMRLLGHKVGNITNDVYGHRTLGELRQEIEKIKVPGIIQK